MHSLHKSSRPLEKESRRRRERLGLQRLGVQRLALHRIGLQLAKDGRVCASPSMC